jgi:hypothetical protein
MAVNPFFSAGKGIGNRSEQNYQDQLFIECIKRFGHDMKYIPRSTFKIDHTLGEDPNSFFASYKTIEMYIENATDFGGQHEFIDKFHLDVQETATFVMSRTRFRQVFENQFKPNEGDLVYFPVTNRLFEINFVEDDDPFFPLSKQTAFSLKCSLFDFSYEDFDTGYQKVDESLDFETTKDPFDDTEQLDSNAEPYLDFSESNPFGEIIDRDDV